MKLLSPGELKVKQTEMEIFLPGGDRVDARYRGHTICTHQDGSLPAPFDLFLVSIGTCVGIYVARFCRKRNIPLDDVRIVQRQITDPKTRLVGRIEVDIHLPEGFPERYCDAVIRAAGLCAVKKHMDCPPAFDAKTIIGSTERVGEK